MLCACTCPCLTISVVYVCCSNNSNSNPMVYSRAMVLLLSQALPQTPRHPVILQFLHHPLHHFNQTFIMAVTRSSLSVLHRTLAELWKSTVLLDFVNNLLNTLITLHLSPMEDILSSLIHLKPTVLILRQI